MDVSQHDPLHKLGMTERDILLDVMAVSAQLDLLFRKELSNVRAYYKFAKERFFIAWLK